VPVNSAEGLSIQLNVTNSMHPLNLGSVPATNGRVTRTIV
jgi:hypothetical protein